MEPGSLVEVAVGLNHSAYTELPDHQVPPIALHLTEEHHIPIPVFQDDSSGVHRAADETDWEDEHSGFCQIGRDECAGGLNLKLPLSILIEM